MFYGSKTIAVAVNRVRDGEKIYDVARSIGANRATVAKWCADAGIVSAHAYQPWTEDAVSHFETLWRDGVPVVEISRRTGRSRDALIAYAYRHRDRFPARPHGGAHT